MAKRTISEAVGHLCACTRAGTLADLPDGPLLERFANHREEAAFAAMLLRHGSMVLHVCRRVGGPGPGASAEPACPGTAGGEPAPRRRPGWVRPGAKCKRCSTRSCGACRRSIAMSSCSVTWRDRRRRKSPAISVVRSGRCVVAWPGRDRCCRNGSSGQVWYDRRKRAASAAPWRCCSGVREPGSSAGAGDARPRRPPEARQTREVKAALAVFLDAEGLLRDDLPPRLTVLCTVRADRPRVVSKRRYDRIRYPDRPGARGMAAALLNEESSLLVIAVGLVVGLCA